MLGLRLCFLAAIVSYAGVASAAGDYPLRTYTGTARRDWDAVGFTVGPNESASVTFTNVTHSNGNGNWAAVEYYSDGAMNSFRDDQEVAKRSWVVASEGYHVIQGQCTNGNADAVGCTITVSGVKYVHLSASNP